MNKHYMNLGQYNNRHVTKYVNLKLFGTLNENDLSQINAEFDKVYTDNRNIATVGNSRNYDRRNQRRYRHSN